MDLGPAGSSRKGDLDLAGLNPIDRPDVTLWWKGMKH
jgi:hypothetical protein